MSKRNGKKLRFLGYAMTHAEANKTISVIEMTVGRFGLHKRFFKTEETFWDAIHHTIGTRRQPTETFFDAIDRLAHYLGGMSPHQRTVLLSAIDRKALYAAAKVKPGDYQELGNTVILPRSEADRKPKAPRAVRQPKSRTASAGRQPTVSAKDEFYKSWEWRTLRMEALKEFGRACQCCGATPGMKDAAGQPVRICVDHIKPISKFWNLRLQRSNLQILCDECNQGKGNWDETDFRPAPEPDEWAEPEFDDIALDVLASMAPANGVAV